MKKLSATLIAGLSLGPLAVGAQSEVDFPELTGRVVDNADLLADNLESILVQQLREHEEATTNQVVVVTVPSLQGLHINTYAYELGNHWGIGQADKDNGVLLLVAPNERRVRIAVGLGLESTLTNRMAGEIIGQDILPRFRQGGFEHGISAGVYSILAALEGRYSLNPSANNGQTDTSTGDLVAGGLGGLITLLLTLVGGRGRYRTGGGSSFGGGGGGSFSGGGGSFGGGGATGSW